MKFLESTWRRAAAPLIARILLEHAGSAEPILRKALREAYPFGPRRYHPYKIWLDEIARQRGRKPQLGKRKPQPGKCTIPEIDERQAGLFA